MPQTGITRRDGGVYYYRRKVPIDLRPHFQRREIKSSLRTTKLREASTLGYEHAHYWAREFERIRAGGLQNVPREDAEAQGLLEALGALPIEEAAQSPKPIQAKILLRSIDDEF